MDPENIMAYDLFHNLTREEIGALLSTAGEMTVEKGTRIIEESSDTSDLFVLLDGKVAVEFEIIDVDNDTAFTLQLVHLAAGDVIGEIAFLEKHNRTASVTAVEKTTLLKFEGDRLHELFGRNSLIGYLVMQNLALILIERLKRSNLEWLKARLPG